LGSELSGSARISNKFVKGVLRRTSIEESDDGQSRKGKREGRVRAGLSAAPSMQGAVFVVDEGKINSGKTTGISQNG